MNEVCSKVEEKKYVKLVEGLQPTHPESKFPQHPERYVHNISSLQLSQLQLDALSLGPKFCYSQPVNGQVHIETQFEHLMHQLTDLTPTSALARDTFKTTLVHFVQQYLACDAKTSNILSMKHRDAIRELRANPDVILSKPDKGSGWVLMNKSDYTAKLLAILQDSSKFVRDTVQKDRTAQDEVKITKVLKELRQQNLINDSLLDQLTPVGSHPSRLYGLPKIHKPHVPLRPIIDMSSSAFHSVAKWLVEVLEPVRKELCTHALKGSFNLLNASRT